MRKVEGVRRGHRDLEARRRRPPWEGLPFFLLSEHDRRRPLLLIVKGRRSAVPRSTAKEERAASSRKIPR